MCFHLTSRTVRRSLTFYPPPPRPLRRAASAFFRLSCPTSALTMLPPRHSPRPVSSPVQEALISWSGIKEAASGDWLAVVCLPSLTYFYWVYTSGKPTDSALLTLFANGKNSSCDSLAVVYYSSSKVIGQTAAITIAPMIQQIHCTGS